MVAKGGELGREGLGLEDMWKYTQHTAVSLEVTDTYIHELGGVA